MNEYSMERSPGYHPGGRLGLIDVDERTGELPIIRPSDSLPWEPDQRQPEGDYTSLVTPHGRQSSSSMNDRRTVTILFCDVTGSTAMAGRLDPEDWADVMGEAFNYLIQPVERYGGMVARLMGDSILAFFGAPRAREDDPRRAVLAGLEIIEGIKPFREEVKRLYGMDFNVRVGINTGLVILGEFGSEQAFEYTAMGDAINLANRMEQMAEPGTLQIAHGTYRLIAPYFETVLLGELPVRGKDEPEPIYRVIRPRDEPDKPSGIAGLAAPMVGRDHEFAILRQALDNLEQGKGQIITLIGESGLGKTRLLSELRQEWEHRRAQSDKHSSVWLGNQIILYESLQPYGAFQQRVRRTLQIKANDPPAAVRAKVAGMTTRLPVKDPDRTAAAINLLLGVADTSDEAHVHIDGEEFRREIFSLMTDTLRNWNPGGSVVYVVDDSHWGDYASTELLTHVMQIVAEVPILFVLAFRPDTASPVWRSREQLKEQYGEYLTELVLEPLSKAASDELLAHVLDDPVLVPELQQLVTDRADGNPLFVEEILRSLIDQGVLQRTDSPAGRLRLREGAQVTAASVPDTLQALLLERMDRLSPEARRVLQQAAVIGRTFSRRILEAIAGNPDQLSEILLALCTTDLVIEVNDDTEETYIFRHALLWETAYRTILRRVRRQYHQSVAEAVELIHADRLDEQAKTIGNHYRLARDERGIAWLIKAAERARAVNAAQAVIDDTTQAIDLAEQVAHPIPATVYRLRGQAYEAIGDPELAREDYHLALEYARLDADAMLEWQSLVDLGMIWMQSDYSQTGAYFEQALDLSQRIGDESVIARSMNRLGNWHTNIEQPDQAVRLHQQALGVFFRLNDESGLADTYDQLGMANLLGGYLDTAANALECSIQLFRKLNDRIGLATSLGTLVLTMGSYDSAGSAPAANTSLESAKFGEEALEIADEIGWRPGQSMVRFMLAYVIGRRGEFEHAMQLAREGLEIAREIGHLQWVVANTSAIGFVLSDLGQYQQALEHFSNALVDAHRIGSRYWQGALSASVAATQTQLGQFDRAEKTLLAVLKNGTSERAIGTRICWYRLAELHIARGEPAKALDIAERLVTTQEPGVDRNPDLAYLRGLAHAGLGSYEEARAAFDEAVTGYDEMGFRPEAQRSRKELSRLHARFGHHEEAAVVRSAADQLAEQIASQISDADLRQGYLRIAMSDDVLHTD